MATTVDLSPAPLNLEGIRAGDKNEVVFNLTLDGSPMDLTGMTLKAQARKEPTDPDPAPIEAVITILGDDPVGGRISVVWPGDQVRSTLNGNRSWNGYWDLQETTDTEFPVTLVAGSFQAEMDVTR